MAITNLLPKEDREGMITSPVFRVPADTKGAYIFKSMLDGIDLRDTKLILKVDIDVSEDGMKWRYFGGIVYKGGIYERETNPGFGIYQGAVIANKYIRVRMEPNKRIPLGAEIRDTKIKPVEI